MAIELRLPDACAREFTDGSYRLLAAASILDQAKERVGAGAVAVSRQGSRFNTAASAAVADVWLQPGTFSSAADRQATSAH